METRDALKIVEGLEPKIRKLVIKYNESKETIKKLKEECDLLQEKLTYEKVQNRQLSEKNKVLKIAKALSGNKEKSTDVKLKINELIREIDKCIAQVNS